MSAPADKKPGIDTTWHAALGQLTSGLSPAALTMSYVDWWLHLLASPDKQPELLRESIIAQGDMYGTSDPRFTDAT